MYAPVVLTTVGPIRYYKMLEPSYRTLHNLVSIEPVRIGYASSEKEASDLVLSQIFICGHLRYDLPP